MGDERTLGEAFVLFVLPGLIVYVMICCQAFLEDRKKEYDLLKLSSLTSFPKYVIKYVFKQIIKGAKSWQKEHPRRRVRS